MNTNPVRTALVIGEPTLERVQAYLPSNYEASLVDGEILIVGQDSAGWTLDGYVLPRMASGNLFAREVV